jgi:acyl-homoserine-lactone acylase
MGIWWQCKFNRQRNFDGQSAYKLDWLLMHQMHLTIPGVIDVAGADFVGVPMPVAGFNNHVAWTIEAPLTVKYYVLQKMAISSENATYDFGGKPVALTFKRTAVAVRSSDGRIATRNFRIPVSNLGPLYQLPESEGQPAGWYAITDAGDSNANGLDQLIAMARARDAKEFVAAVESNRGIGAHMIAADRNGKAIYTEAGPLLAARDDQLAACRLGTDHSPDIVDGSRAACSFRDAGGRPSLAGPDKIPSFTTGGIVHNLNNSYHKSVYQNPATGYSSLLGNADEHDLRLDMSEKRLAEMLGSSKISPDTAVLLALDNRNFAAEQWLDKILAACLPASDRLVLQACKVLKNWDRRNNVTSRGPALFSEIWSRLSETDAYQNVTSGSVTLSAKTVLDVRNVIAEATAHLNLLGIPLERQWGDLMVRNTAKGRVLLHGGSGNEGVLNVLEGEGLDKEGYANISNGTSYLQLVYWDNGTIKAKTLLAQGQSSDLNSPHYDDQLGHYVRKELALFPFEKSDVASATIEQITIDQ